MTDGRSRIAVVLFNLGGPDRSEAVRPFLFNLFNDPAIIGAPAPVRWMIAQLISRRRAPIAREIYANFGGGSPLLANTKDQAEALERALSSDGEVRCFIAMRYWYPFASDTAREIAAFAPDRIVLLPLYPQFSTATTGSSFADWRAAARAAGLDLPTYAVGCYPRDKGFVVAVAEMTAVAWRDAASAGRPRILFSAHGLPKKVVDRGDPYQWQVEQSAAAIAAEVTRRLGEEPDWLVSYQSRVGPLEWIQPYTDAEIKRAGHEQRPLVVVPIAFVSEHSETLVELDIEYRDLGAAHGVPAYVRVPTVRISGEFIEGLARLIRGALAKESSIESGEGGRICPAEWSRCICRAQEIVEVG